MRDFVLVCAPAGYGKTVLLAEWVRRGRHPVAWLSLDAGDNDPVRFWRHTVAALDRVRPGISERVGPFLGPPAPRSFEPLVTALINEVTGQPDADEALLVLDDYHVISSQLVHGSLGFLLEHRPPGLVLALTSRSDPPLALARLRARGELTELRAAELRFNSGEAAALLQQVAAAPGGARPGAPLPAAVAAALAARTEGWAAGLQLAGLSLRGQADVAAFVAAFTGSHRYVLDFLAEEVLEQQNRQRRTFLLETSVLERLSGELCDAVTGRLAARRCSRRPNGRACSWCRWMRCAAGGVTTTCSPTCSAPACRPNSPAGFPDCTVTQPPGMRSAGWPMTRSGTRWPLGR